MSATSDDGYIQTDIGVVPTDWGTSTLRPLLDRPPRYGINAAAVADNGSLPTYIRITDITEDGKFAPDPRVAVDNPASDSYYLSHGDIVAARTGASVGKSYRYNPGDGRLVFAGFLICISPNEKWLDSRYLAYYMQSSRYWNWVRQTSMRSGQPGINGREYAGLVIAVPRLDEQRRIGEALSDVDALIASLEQLIAKEQAIKQGMMQQLLAGKTRLPGFTKPWRDVRLRDVLRVRHGRSQKGVETAGGRYPILASGGEIGRTNVALYSKPSVLIGRKGTINRPQFQSEPFWTVDTLFYTEIAGEADPKFLFYVFMMIDWRSMNEASGVPSLSSGRVEAVSVSVPTVDEQRAIAALLDEAESEIGLLRTRLTKAKAVKQGMMQELLTGRTRLSVRRMLHE